MPNKSRKWWFVGLGLLLIGYLAYRFRHVLASAKAFNWRSLWQAVQGVNPWYILVCVFLIYVCYGLRALRWQNFQKHLGQASFKNILVSTIAGFSAVFVMGRLGEPVRPVLISRKDKIPLADSFGLYALERLLDLGFAILILASWFLTATIQKYVYAEVSTPVLEGARKTAGTILTFGLVGIVAMTVYVRRYGATALERGMQEWLAIHGWRASVARIVLGVARGLKTIRSWNDLFSALAVSAVHWMLIILIYYLVPLAFGGPLAKLRLQDSVLVLAMTLVGSIFQLPGVGGGPQLVMTGAYTSLFGVPREIAVAAAMVLWLITFAACTFAGLPILFREGWSLGELRKMRAQEDNELDAEMANLPERPLP
jgi:glycosyltransferase 2 family protein